ncbi:MAG TPA: protein translocase subunit SecF [Candidatus Paceibacterota bacterium]
MYIVNHRTIFFWITGVILAVAIGAIAFFGMPLSIDFTGGSLVEVQYTDARPPLDTLKSNVDALKLGETSLRESGENGVTLRAPTLTPEQHEAVLKALGLTTAAPASATSTATVASGTAMVAMTLPGQSAATTSSTTAALTESRFTSIGPSLGSELGKKAIWALVAVILAIVLYITWAFRRVSRPVPSWVYGLAVIAILIHDIIIPTGFYAILAHFTGAEADTLFVVALLAILGYSVNDTIVIFDRVREHLANNEKQNVRQPFDEVVGQAITETLGRSINTSLTVVLALLALAVLGSAATIDFAIVLLVGVVAGTYSSILLAAPLLVPLARWLGYSDK